MNPPTSVLCFESSDVSFQIAYFYNGWLLQKSIGQEIEKKNKANLFKLKLMPKNGKALQKKTAGLNLISNL